MDLSVPYKMCYYFPMPNFVHNHRVFINKENYLQPEDRTWIHNHSSSPNTESIQCHWHLFPLQKVPAQEMPEQIP